MDLIMLYDHLVARNGNGLLYMCHVTRRRTARTRKGDLL